MLNVEIHGCRITADEDGKLFVHDLDGTPLGECDNLGEAVQIAKRWQFRPKAEAPPESDPLAPEPKQRHEPEE